MSNTLLELKEINAYYGGLKALEGINLTINCSEIVGIIGANGAGKTTSLRVIFGLLQPQNGSVLYEGEPIEREPHYHRAYRGISFVPEGGRVFSRLSTRENLEMGAFIKKSQKEVADNLEMVFSLFPALKMREKARGGTLSGGERQMLAIGRGLMLSPKLILLDEPSLGLAPLVVDDIYKKIQEIRKNNVTILLVEQNARKALEVADRVYVFAVGRIAMEGPSRHLLKNSDIKKTFLGG